MKARKGFTLVEVVACTIILAMVTIGTVSISGRINVMRTDARNATYLSLHNLNVMEELRQRLYNLGPGEELPGFYNATEFSSSTITTTVKLDMATWDNFRVYDVVIDSRVNATKQPLRSRYTLTNIGRPTYIDDIRGIEDLDGYLEE